MMGKSPDVQFGIWFSTWNVGSMAESGVKYLRLWKYIVLIFAICRKWDGNGKGLKWLEMVLNFFEFGVLKQKTVWV